MGGLRAFFAAVVEAVEAVEAEAKEEVEGAVVVVDGDGDVAGTVVAVVSLVSPPAASAFAASVTGEDVEVVEREAPIRKDKKCELARRASIERLLAKKKREFEK